MHSGPALRLQMTPLSDLVGPGGKGPMQLEKSRLTGGLERKGCWWESPQRGGKEWGVPGGGDGARLDLAGIQNEQSLLPPKLRYKPAMVPSNSIMRSCVLYGNFSHTESLGQENCFCSLARVGRRLPSSNGSGWCLPPKRSKHI